VTAGDALDAVIVEAIERGIEQVKDRLGPRAFTAQEAAQRLGVSDETVRRLVRDGHLRAVPHLSHIRIATDELEAFMRGER
jgi:excisionase family DNA binding protein